MDMINVDNREYCCPEFATAFCQRQIVYSMDGGGSWNIQEHDPFAMASLEGIRYCPFCGTQLPMGDNWDGEL